MHIKCTKSLCIMYYKHRYKCCSHENHSFSEVTSRGFYDIWQALRHNRVYTSLPKPFWSDSTAKIAHEEMNKNDTSNKSQGQFAVSRHFIRENSAQSAKTNIRVYEASEMRHQQRVCEHNYHAAVTLIWFSYLRKFAEVHCHPVYNGVCFHDSCDFVLWSRYEITLKPFFICTIKRTLVNASRAIEFIDKFIILK